MEAIQGVGMLRQHFIYACTTWDEWQHLMFIMRDAERMEKPMKNRVKIQDLCPMLRDFIDKVNKGK